MERIVALVGSPRKPGNCELAARYVAWEAGCDEVELVMLNSKNILPCRACYRCLEGTCPLEDDYGWIVDRIIAAGAVIISVPSYFFGPNASAKRFLDRCLQLYALYDQILGKPAVGICIAGMKFGEGYTKLGVENMMLRMGLQNRGAEIIYGALPGEIFTVDGNIEVLKNLGKSLTGQGREEAKGDKGGCFCASCGHTHFSLTGRNSATCLLCGTRHSSAGEVVLERLDGTGVRLGSMKEIVEHREWLIGMKKRYGEMRGELKKVIGEYQRPGREV